MEYVTDVTTLVIYSPIRIVHAFSVVTLLRSFTKRMKVIKGIRGELTNEFFTLESIKTANYWIFHIKKCHCIKTAKVFFCCFNFDIFLRNYRKFYKLYALQNLHGMNPGTFDCPQIKLKPLIWTLVTLLCLFFVFIHWQSLQYRKAINRVMIYWFIFHSFKRFFKDL